MSINQTITELDTASHMQTLENNNTVLILIYLHFSEAELRVTYYSKKTN